MLIRTTEAQITCWIGGAGLVAWILSCWITAGL